MPHPAKQQINIVGVRGGLVVVRWTAK